MIQDLIFYVIGGLGLFYLGMGNLSAGLKRIAGERLKNFMHAVTKHRIYGIFVGTFITMLIQSSSATTVMVVGFINAGLLTLRQAIPVIMGANIGTTFTAWLVSSMSVFKITSYAMPAIGIGFALNALSKKQRRKNWGQTVMGFGLLFLGLGLLKDAFEPLKDSPAVHDLFLTLSHNPLLGVLVGIIFTVLLQSSSATIAIVQVLAFNGLMDFNTAIPIILGDNIGTTVTAQMAAVGTNINARRGAMAHTFFNVIGVGYMLFFAANGSYGNTIDSLIPGEITTANIMMHIAVAHSAFNIINTTIFFPFVRGLEAVATWLVPQKGDAVESGPQYLEPHLLDTPSLAKEQIHNEMAYMLKVSRKAVTNGVESFLEGNTAKADKASELEDVTDELQNAITDYIVNLSERHLEAAQSEELPVLLHMVNDLERIGDHAQNLAELAKRRVGEDLAFPEDSLKELTNVWEILKEMFDNAEQALKSSDTYSAERMLLKEKEINRLHAEYKQTHIHRLHQGQSPLTSGFMLVEDMDNIERVADRLTNVAESVLHQMRWQPEDPSVT